MPVPPSVCPHGTLDDFDKILYLIIFQKTVEEIQVSLKVNKNNAQWRSG
jgi:hypothetical protein